MDEFMGVGEGRKIARLPLDDGTYIELSYPKDMKICDTENEEVTQWLKIFSRRFRRKSVSPELEP
jgi:hypothetical protein